MEQWVCQVTYGFKIGDIAKNQAYFSLLFCLFSVVYSLYQTGSYDVITSFGGSASRFSAVNQSLFNRMVLRGDN